MAFFDHTPLAPTAVVRVDSVTQSCPDGLNVFWVTSDPSNINSPPEETMVVLTLTVGGEVGGANLTANVFYEDSGVSYITSHIHHPPPPHTHHPPHPTHTHT